MSCSFYWCLCAITKEEYRTLKAKSIAADKQSVIPKHYLDAYNLCMDSPQEILPKFIPFDELPEEKKKQDMYKNGCIEGKLSDDFSLSLYIPEYEDIFQELPLNEEDVMKFISLKGTTPVSVLYYALGPKLAEKLPGLAGNMIVKFEDLEHTYCDVEEILLSLNEAAWDRARRYISVCSAGRPTKGYDDEIKEIFRAIPDCIKEAKQRGKCFASVTSREF